MLDKLGLPAEQCIAVEDSENGLRSSLAAGLDTVVTVNGYTRFQDFTGAKLVLSDLGEPAQPFNVLAGEAGKAQGINGSGWVDVDLMLKLKG